MRHKELSQCPAQRYEGSLRPSDLWREVWRRDLALHDGEATAARVIAACSRHSLTSRSSCQVVEFADGCDVLPLVHTRTGNVQSCGSSLDSPQHHPSPPPWVPCQQWSWWLHWLVITSAGVLAKYTTSDHDCNDQYEQLVLPTLIVFQSLAISG